MFYNTCNVLYISLQVTLYCILLQELYCESYNNVAVMFASICNFNDFWLAVQANGHGFGCLKILNEIIADFDELLGLPAFVEVEKIKTIGSTYMTCVGLSPVQKVIIK